MLEDLEKYHGTVLVWAGLGGGSISLPYLAHEAFDRVEPIEELELSIRAYNCLMRAGISTVGKLQATDDEDLRNIRNLGRKK